MIEVLMENKWLLLAVAEILAWLSTFGFFFARYWWKSSRWERLALFLGILTGVLPHLTLAAVDCWQTGKVGLFPGVVALLLLYSLTRGKRDMARIDRWIKGKVTKWQEQQSPS